MASTDRTPRAGPADFDQLAEVYDQTREPAAPATLDGFARVLRSAGARRLLEVGVGTGRVAAPMAERGFELAGIDLSRGMLARARGRLSAPLVRGSAYALPFADGALDATYFSHVLHVLDHPAAAIAEGVRAGRAGAFALLQPKSDPPAPGEEDGWAARRAVYELLNERGHSTPTSWGGPGARERGILRENPPDATVVLRDEWVEEPVSKTLEMLEKGGSRHLVGVPREDVRAAVARVRQQLGDRRFRFRRLEVVARWVRPPARPR